MKRTAILTATVATALALTACGSDTTDTAGDFTPASQDPTSMATPTTDSGRLHKNPGDKAGFTGPQGPVLTFTVDNINTDTTCEGPGGPPALPGKPEGQFLKVNMTVTADSDMPTELTNALAGSYWATVDSDGVTNTDISTVECDSDNSQLAHIQAGNTYKLNLVFDVPTNAQQLIFQADSANTNGWEWDIS